MHVVGFIIRIYHDAQSSECQRCQQIHTQCMNSVIFILLQYQDFQFSGCEMTATPFKTKSKTYGKSRKTQNVKYELNSKSLMQAFQFDLCHLVSESTRTFHVTQTVTQNLNNLHAQCITKRLFNLVIIIMLLQNHAD